MNSDKVSAKNNQQMKSWSINLNNILDQSIWACFRRRHHKCIGKNPTPHSPTMKLFFHVQMALSAPFLLCIWGGANFHSNDFLSKVLRDSGTSFSIQYVAGLNPLLSSSSWTFLWDFKIYFSALYLCGSVIISLVS